MRTLHPMWFALISVSAMPAGAADAIGSIYSGGAYQMDGVDIRGNATLFDGSTLEIGEAAAQIHLANGAGMWLAPKSRATMSARGIRLLSGMGQFETPAEYRLEARAVRVAASQPHTTVRVALDESGGAIVAPVNGSVQVTNTRGMRIGELTQGNTVRFADQPGAAAAVNVSGCLSRDRDQFTLTDDVTNVPVRLTGKGLGQEVGHLVSVSGVEGTQTGDSANVTVTGMRRLSAGPCGTTGSAQNAGLLAMARPLGIAAQLQTAGPRLMLLVVEGEGAINNIRQRTAREPIVEVQDENHRPVAGALVLFALPRNGAGGTFANGSNTLSVTTDAQGRAVARGVKPNNVAGQFQIAVTASYGGLTASIAIHQLNSLTAATTAGTSSTAAAASNARNGGALQADGTASSAGGDSAGTANAGGTGASGSGAGGTGAGTGATGAGGAGGNGGAAGGAASAAGSSGAGASGVGMAIGTKVAIIGGVTATAVGGGLAAAGAFSGGTEPAVSR